MSLRHDCLRCLGYVIMRSQLTFWHTPLAPLLIGANQYFYLLRHILSLGCDGGIRVRADTSEGSCFCDFPGKMGRALVFKMGTLPRSCQI